MNLQFLATQVERRTKGVHQWHCSAITGPAKDLFSTTYGVSTDSVLNRLSYYHVTSGLPPDVMHDILEGVAVVELKCMLMKFSQDYNLSLVLLNDRIDHFPYGLPDIKSKPLKLPASYSSTDHESLKQSGTTLV